MAVTGAARTSAGPVRSLVLLAATLTSDVATHAMALEGPFLGGGRILILKDASILEPRSRAQRVKTPFWASVQSRLSLAAITGAVFFFAVSFFVAPPVDPAAFYRQRNVLPVLVVASISLLAARLVREGRYRACAAAAGIVTTVNVILQLAETPRRLARLESDARNVTHRLFRCLAVFRGTIARRDGRSLPFVCSTEEVPGTWNGNALPR